MRNVYTLKQYALLLLLLISIPGYSQLLDPRTQPKFQNELPIPAVIDATQGGLFEMYITQFEQDLGLVDALGNKLITTVWGYNGQYPGPSFVTKKDVPIEVYWYNHLTENGDGTGNPLPHLLPIDESIHWAMKHVENWEQYGVPTVTHLHGGHTESESDGLPEAWFTPNFTKVGTDFKKGDDEPYYYHNDQEAATLWYHDHALGITRLNVYAGLAGFYLLTDDHEQHLKETNQIPADPYDIGLAIQDRMFTPDGQLFYAAGHGEASISPEFFGNVILVNGKAWPVLEVEPRQYRFRMLNGSDSRFYNLFMPSPLLFWQIGSDNGFLPAPVAHNQLLISPGERKDVMIDFSDPVLWGQTIIIRNNAKTPYPKGSAPDPNAEGQIMAFRVNQPLNTDFELTPVPQSLRTTAMFDHGSPTKTRKLLLFEGTDEQGRLKAMLGTIEDGPLDWDDEITENPDLNATEVWEIYNTTPDSHPIHLHLVSFEVLSSQKFRLDFEDPEEGIVEERSIRLLGQPKPPEPGQNGRKDTYPIAPGEVTRLIAKFDREGLYVWHCHILSHEDHEMMRPYYVGDMPDHMLASHSAQNKEELAIDKEELSIYPNPFSGSATVQLKVTEPSAVAVRILDIRGRLVREVPVKKLEAGTHQLEIKSADMQTGMYICEVEMNNKLYRSRLVLSR